MKFFVLTDICFKTALTIFPFKDVNHMPDHFSGAVNLLFYVFCDISSKFGTKIANYINRLR